MQPTSSIFAYIYRVRYSVRSSHVSHVTTPTPVWTVTESDRNCSRNQRQNRSITKEPQCADHAVIETLMTHTTNEISSGIYTPGDRQETDR